MFVQLDNLDDLITLLHGNLNFIYDPLTREGTLGNRLVSAFAIRVTLGGARTTQAEHQPAVAAIWQQWRVESLGRQDVAFYQSLFPQHGFSILARLTHMTYGMSHGKFEIFTHVRI